MNNGTLGFEVFLILLLALLNGVFAMSEIAVVSSRKSRLRQRAEDGRKGARRALDLAENPTRFLSTVQVGITLIGVFAGAYGGASIAGHLDHWLEGIPFIGRYSQEVALGTVVAAITYLTLVVGELVPKRIALHDPERIASLVAAPMHGLSVVTAPLVKLLSLSTNTLLRLLRLRKSDEPPVTQEDVSDMLDVGLEAGIFEEEEHDLVERIFWLGDQRVESLMTPRTKVEWLDINDPPEVHRQVLVRHRFAHYPVCDGTIDRVVGMVRAKDLVADLVEDQPLDIRAAARRPLYAPEGMGALQLLELFRETGIHLAIVVDEFGGTDGVVTLNDLVEGITGRLSSAPRARPRRGGG
ncbi:MAG TPA: hemolysin family protein [Longimicrobiales bacterium]|nr:hemolysin family protein [Longimicrobiales bacterium]